MASYVLYPPIVDSYMPAFQDATCRIYFSLSKYNSISDVKSIHISVCKQSTGMNVVNKSDDISLGHYRSTGIIIANNGIKRDSIDAENLYYFEIDNSDIKDGWQVGWIYKIQLRLSLKEYDPTIPQSTWLNNNSGLFSEWSTICTTKFIGNIIVEIPTIDYDSSKKDGTIEEEVKNLYLSTLDLYGHINSVDKSERLYKYNFKLYNEYEDILLEDSGELYSNKYQDINDSDYILKMNEFKYTMKTELENEKIYILYFNYETNNGFKESHRIKFMSILMYIDTINCYMVTADNDPDRILKNITSVSEEEEEGKIGIKLRSSDSGNYNGNICVRRCSSKDNFSYWTDIKIIVCKQQSINDIPIFYDYTIESGVLYKYGVQSIKADGERGVLVQMLNPVMRNFEYSFLLGENNQQLKLQFNNTMNSYKIQMMESKTEPIGGMYPVITRNASLRYRIFPINGTITFWMDEKNSFTNKYLIYNESELYSHPIVDFYNNYNKDNNIVQYDYIYERDFRKQVLEFLHDGNFKLFKSPTEGNIIVRLTDINCTPTQSLDRMIYDFTAIASEMAEASMENYLKYHFYEIGECSEDFSTTTAKLGQLQMEFNSDTNVINEIFKKYDRSTRNSAGSRISIVYISYLKITIDDPPFRVQNNSGNMVIGNNISSNKISKNMITIYGDVREYTFDERIVFEKGDNLYLLGDAQGKKTSVNATIDFIYHLKTEPYIEKQISSKEVRSGMGQVFDYYVSGTSIYKDIYYKYYLETEKDFRRLSKIDALEIEAEPGAIFRIKDEVDEEDFEINQTGLLRLVELGNISQITFKGIRDRQTGEIITSGIAMDILINYHYTITVGKYK